jgi:hypothetical protein
MKVPKVHTRVSYTGHRTYYYRDNISPYREQSIPQRLVDHRSKFVLQRSVLFHRKIDNTLLGEMTIAKAQKLYPGGLDKVLSKKSASIAANEKEISHWIKREKMLKDHMQAVAVSLEKRRVQKREREIKAAIKTLKRYLVDTTKLKLPLNIEMKFLADGSVVSSSQHERSV